MTPPPPPRTTPSLAARLRTAIGQAKTGRSRGAGIAVALLLAAAPLATWAGARWAESRVRGDIAAVERTARPRLADRAAIVDARRDLLALADVPGVAATLDGLAGAVPQDAAIVSAGRGADHRLGVTVAAADPDRLRAALRHRPATAGLRDTGQRRGDGGMAVTLEEPR